MKLLSFPEAEICPVLILVPASNSMEKPPSRTHICYLKSLGSVFTFEHNAFLEYYYLNAVFFVEISDLF